MRKPWWGTPGGVVLAVLLAGCGDMPKPFQHELAGQPLTRLETANGVEIVAPSEDPTLAESLRQVLLAADVPARVVAQGDMGSYRAQSSAVEGGVRWELFNPEGNVLLRRTLGDRTPESIATLAQAIQNVVEQDMEAPLTKRMAAAAPAAIPGLRAPPDATLKAPGEPAGPPAVDTLPAVAIGDVGGFDEDRDRILRGALETGLRNAGLKVSPNAGLVIDGGVTQEVVDGVTRLRVVWTVRDTEDTEIGSISQENPVEELYLTKQFPALAVAIVGGGVEGVYAMLSRLRLPAAEASLSPSAEPEKAPKEK